MKIASIDIGSNSVILLITTVVDGKIHPIENFYYTPRIADGITANKEISDNKIKLLLSILLEISDICKSNKCDKILVSATNAFRIASNSAQIIHQIKNLFGYEINVISGEVEAELTYLGTIYELKSSYSNLVIDIGGGSTEIIFGNSKNILFKKSCNIGIIVIKEQNFKNNSQIISWIKNILDSCFPELLEITDTKFNIISVAGIPTSLAAIKYGFEEYSEIHINNKYLNLEDLRYFIDIFSNPNLFEPVRKKYFKILLGREDLMLFGTLLLNSILEFVKKEGTFVSTKGLRYGAILKYIQNL